MGYRIMAAALAGAVLSGCAYNAETSVAPAHNVVTSFSSKAPGKWLLRTETERLRETVRATGLACAAHNYPLDFASGFPGSLRGTLANVVDTLADAPPQLPADKAGSLGARGIITIRGESLRGDFVVIEGFMSSTIRANVEIAVSVAVDGRSGRLFGKTIDGRGRGEGDVGAFCSGAAEAIKKAADEAQRDALRRIGEEIGNSERIRSGR